VITRSAKILTEVIIGVIALAALVLGLAVWRLSSGPLSVGFLTPLLEQSFADNERGLALDVGETTLSWKDGSRTLDLRARSVRIVNDDGTTIAAVPEVSVSLSLAALLRGMIAATEVEVVDARVTLVRKADGRFALASRSAAEEVAVEDKDPEFSAVLPALVELFMRAPDRRRPLDYLDVVRVVDGQFIVIDRRLETFWFAPDARMELRRHEKGVAAFMGLQLAVGPELADANLAILFDQPQQAITVAANLAGFHADAVAAVAPLPENFSGFHVPLEADVKANLTTQGKLTSASFEITGGAGEISAPPYLPQPKAVTGVELRGSFDGATQRLEVTSANLDFGSAEQAGPSLTMTASAQSDAAEVDISAEARIDVLPVEQLKDFWPQAAAPGGREWVTENIPGGLVENVLFSLAARMPLGRPEGFEIVSLEGGFDLQGLEVHYLRPVPPISDITGRARLEGMDLKFQVDSGRQGALAVRDTRVDILDMADDSRLEIAGTVGGPLNAVLEVLDHERLDLLRRVGLDPATATGEAETELLIDFPLIDDLGLDQVSIGATAEVRQGGVARFLLGRDASDMDLDLTVDTDGLSLSGDLRLAGVTAVMDWQEDFTGGPEVRTRLELDLPDVETAGRRALGLDLAPYVEGPVSIAAIATVGQDQTGTVNLAANLADAELSLPFLRWGKPAGQSGALRLSLALQDEQVAGLNDFDLSAGTLLARGGGELLSGGTDFRTLRFDELAFDGTTLREVTLDRVGDGFAIDLGQGVLDAAPFLEDQDPESGAEESEIGAPESERPESAAADDGTPLKITGKALDALYFDEGRHLRKADLSLERSKIGWERVHLHGEVPEALWQRRKDGSLVGDENERQELKTFDLSFGPAEDGGFRMNARMNDMGAGLRALGIIDTVEGGALEVTGSAAGPVPKHPLHARIEAKDYLLRDAPVMAQLLSLASFTGISDVLNGDGLKFKRLVGEFDLHNGVAESELIRAYGNALGLTAKGRLDFDRDTIDVEGTVVPAYTVNRIIGEIPLLGPLLVGGEGEGFLAVVYEIDGKLSDPEVSVNPLSVLTPGFLRGIFGIGGGEDDEKPRATPGRYKG